MKTSKYRYLFAAVVAAASFISGCQNAGNTNNTANKNSNHSPNTNANKPEASPTPSVSTGTVGSLATPTDAYKTAHELRKNKDIEGLKKVMSKDILEFFTEVGKAENKTLDDMLKEMTEKPQAATAEVRNEKITGNRAVLEYLDENGKWKEVDFEKVGDEWKMTFPKGMSEKDEPTKKP